MGTLFFPITESRASRCSFFSGAMYSDTEGHPGAAGHFMLAPHSAATGK